LYRQRALRQEKLSQKRSDESADISTIFILPLAALAAMSGLPDILNILDGLEKLSLPSANLPVSDLIKFPLPPQRKSKIHNFHQPHRLPLQPLSKHYCFRHAGDSGSTFVRCQSPRLRNPSRPRNCVPVHRDKGNRYQVAFRVNPLAPSITTHHRRTAEQKWAF
jgi:hypothetical protein